MDNNDLPLLPQDASGPDICAQARVQLAVLHDLPPEQAQALYKHINSCAACAEEFRTLTWSTRLVAAMADSTPSTRVDDAVCAVIAARGGREPAQESRRGHVGARLIAPSQLSAGGRGKKASLPLPLQERGTRKRFPYAGIHNIGAGLVSALAAAVLLLAMLVAAYSFVPSAQAFAIPANVSWSRYVLYHSETRMSTRPYRVETYHDLGTDSMHVETIMNGSLDVVAIREDHKTLGMDMMHHVAQWGANAWCTDDALFNLPALRSDLKSGSAVYLGKDRFQGKGVYRIRTRNGYILLLDMQYMPVNVLRGEHNKPMYDTLVMYLPQQVSDSMWNMSVPASFHMGSLPVKP